MPVHVMVPPVMLPDGAPLLGVVYAENAEIFSGANCEVSQRLSVCDRDIPAYPRALARYRKTDPVSASYCR